MLDDHLYGVFGISYYNLFVSYSNYYEEIQEFSKIGKENILDQLRKGEYHYIVHLLTYKNIIKYFLYVRDFSFLFGLLTVLLGERFISRTTEESEEQYTLREDYRSHYTRPSSDL